MIGDIGETNVQLLLPGRFRLEYSNNEKQMFLPPQNSRIQISTFPVFQFAASALHDADDDICCLLIPHGTAIRRPSPDAERHFQVRLPRSAPMSHHSAAPIGRSGGDVSVGKCKILRLHKNPADRAVGPYRRPRLPRPQSALLK